MRKTPKRENNLSLSTESYSDVCWSVVLQARHFTYCYEGGEMIWLSSLRDFVSTIEVIADFWGVVWSVSNS